MSQNRQTNLAIVQMLVCSALWSIAGIFIKLIPWNSFVIAGIRSLISGLVVLVYMKMTHQRVVINRKTLTAGVLLSALFFCFVGANKLTTAANAIALQYSAPLHIMLITALVYHRRLRRADVLAAVVTMCGIVLFFLDQLGPGHLMGNLVALASGVFMALMYLNLDRMEGDERMSYVFLGQILTFVFSLPFLALQPPVFTGTSVVCILVLGVFQLGIPYVLCALASQHCPPIALSLLSALEPLLNPVWVLIFDGERPGTMALLGGIVVITAVTVWTIFGQSRAPKEA